MYKISVYSLNKKLLKVVQVEEYPTPEQIDDAMAATGGNGFADICRCNNDPMEHDLGFMEDLQVDLIEG